jgi:hypothetical protein
VTEGAPVEFPKFLEVVGTSAGKDTKDEIMKAFQVYVFLFARFLSRFEGSRYVVAMVGVKGSPNNSCGRSLASDFAQARPLPTLQSSGS